MNPNSGPGTSVNSDYTATMARAKAAGIKMVGYVKTGYQTKSLTDVYAEIDAWYSMYGDYISGIFFDEITNSSDKVCYMEIINNYVKRKYDGLVVANPGTHITDEIAPYADIFVTSELDSASYQNNYYQPTSTFENDPANQNRIFHVVYNVSAADMPKVVQLARDRNAGFVYITDDGNAANTENQYDALPTYFDTLQTEVATLPASSLPVRSATTAPAGCVDPTAVTSTTGDTTSTTTTNRTAPVATTAATTAISKTTGDTLASTGTSLWLYALVGSSLAGTGLYLTFRRKY